MVLFYYFGVSRLLQARSPSRLDIVSNPVTQRQFGGKKKLPLSDAASSQTRERKLKTESEDQRDARDGSAVRQRQNHTAR